MSQHDEPSTWEDRPCPSKAMQRRSFLAALATLAAGHVLNPERLLWVPGAKTIFLPSQLPAFGSLEWIGREACKAISKSVGPARLVGRTLMGDGSIQHQATVSFREVEDYGPVFRALANHVKFYSRTSEFSELLCPGETHDACVVRDEERGVAVRVLRDYDVISDQTLTRIDALYG